MGALGADGYYHHQELRQEVENLRLDRLNFKQALTARLNELASVQQRFNKVLSNSRGLIDRTAQTEERISEVKNASDEQHRRFVTEFRSLNAVMLLASARLLFRGLSVDVCRLCLHFGNWKTQMLLNDTCLPTCVS